MGPTRRRMALTERDMLEVEGVEANCCMKRSSRGGRAEPLQEFCRERDRQSFIEKARDLWSPAVWRSWRLAARVAFPRSAGTRAFVRNKQLARCTTRRLR